MKQADLVIYGTLLVLAVFVTLLSWYGIRSTQKAETAGPQWTVEELRKLAGSRLPDDQFVWGVWQGLLSIEKLRLVVRDAKGAPLTEIVFFELPMDGVLQAFTLEDRRYECVNEGLVSGRSWLRDAQSGEIVLSCQHRALSNTFYRATSDEELFTMKHGSVFKGYSSLLRGNTEIGRLFTLQHKEGKSLVLTGGMPLLSLLEQCFVFVSLPRG